MNNNKEEVIDNYNKYFLNYKENFDSIKKDFQERNVLNTNINLAYIEITNRCNFSCVMCPINDIQHKDKNKDMTLDEFKLVIDKLPSSVKVINPTGLGESSLNKDFMNMLEYAKYKGFEIRHTTNGSIFNVEALKYIDVLTYSLDGISKNILDNIRKNIKVDEAIDKLIFIKNYIKNNSLDTKLRINTALNKINYIDIDNLYKFCDIESIDLTITPTVNNYNHNSSFFLNMEKSIKEDNIMIDWMTVANTYISNNYNFHLEIFYPKREVKGLCTFNFKDIFINNQGNLISCCRRLARPEEFGDLKVQSIDEVFNTKKMKVFKEAHLNNKPFELCDKCSYGVPL